MLRDEGREINHHGRVRKFDADGNEIEEDSEDEGSKYEGASRGWRYLFLFLVTNQEYVGSHSEEYKGTSHNNSK